MTQTSVEAVASGTKYYQELVSLPEYQTFRPYDVANGQPVPVLTGKTLAGDDMIVPEPVGFILKPEHQTPHNRSVGFYVLGHKLAGHKNIVHGGCLATLLDEALCRTAFDKLPNNIGVTASLNVSYKRPTYTGTLVIVRCETVKVEGRKVWVRGSVFDAHDEVQTVAVEAEALVIEPSWAAKLKQQGKQEQEQEQEQEQQEQQQHV